MNIIAIAGPATFDSAVRAARETEGVTLDGLAAPVLGALMGHLEDVWDKIEAALREGYRFGKSRAEAALQAAVESSEQLINMAGDHADEISSALLARTQRFAQAFIRGTLAEVPTSMELSGETYRLNKISWTQTIVVTGSIKASLTELLSFVSEGQVEISGDYGSQTLPQ